MEFGNNGGKSIFASVVPFTLLIFTFYGEVFLTISMGQPIWPQPMGPQPMGPQPMGMGPQPMGMGPQPMAPPQMMGQQMMGQQQMAPQMMGGMMPQQPQQQYMPMQQPAAMQQEFENPNLLTAQNRAVGANWDEFLEENLPRMPYCRDYKSNPNSCNPESSLNPCVACKSTKHIRLLGSYNGCPPDTSFSENLRGSYEWEMAGSRQLTKATRSQYICLVRQGGGGGGLQQQQQLGAGYVPDYAPTGEWTESTTTTFMMFVGGGVGLLVLLCIGIGMCLLMK